MLSFVIPVRHQASVADWPSVKAKLATTLRSVAAQTSGPWNGAVVANQGADLPEVPHRFEVVRVHLPYRSLPDPACDIEAFYSAIRDDKGRRVLAGLLHLRPSGHVMVVDYDDLVHRELAGFVSDAPDANGWFFDAGYLFSGSRLLYRHPREFFEFCGTSHIVRADLLDLPQNTEAASESYIRYRLGSHKFIKSALQEQGTPLSPLPFVGSMYRVGHSGSVTSSSGLLRHVFQPRDITRRPHRVLGRLTRLRLLSAEREREFFGDVAA
jgi:hypothetical protein